MANWKVGGESLQHDSVVQRQAAGTLGGEHFMPSSVSGKKISGIIDDSDPRIRYGFADGYGTSSGSLTLTATTDFQFGGTYTVIGGTTGTGTAGSAAQLVFRGSSITVIGGINPNSGTMRVFIDGVETAGRIPIFCGFRLSSDAAGSSIVSATDTTIPSLANTNFSSSGTIYINGELITYTSKDSNGFYGCVRGVQGTVATSHNANETIYQWASSIGLYSTEYASKQILYHNPLLSPGPHRITIIAETNASSGAARIYFDGFALGSLLGAGNIFTQIATLTTTVTTDANGHSDLFAIVANNNDTARLAFMGMTQSNTETSNATSMCRLGIKYDIASDYRPYYYVHNGPASSTFTITLTFAYIGETI